MDNNEIPFDDFCKMGDTNPAEVIEVFKAVIEVIDSEELWSIFPMGGIVRGMCISILETMTANGPFDEEKASFIDGITQKLVDYKAEEMLEDVGVIDMPNLSTKDKIYVKLGIQLTETFKRNKEKVCEEANGPEDMPPVVIYMLASFDEHEGVKADFQLLNLNVNTDEELSTVLYKTLVDGLAKFGEPAAIGVLNDVYALSVSDSHTILPSSKNYEEDYKSNPSTKVFNALNGMLMAPGQQVVVTSISYSYDDFGKPQFTTKAVDMEDVAEVSLDKTDKGVICRTVNSFFENALVEVESIWKKS
jgi:hypothetical protein